MPWLGRILVLSCGGLVAGACSQGSSGAAASSDDGGVAESGSPDASGDDGGDEFSVKDMGDLALPGLPHGMDVDQTTAKAYVAWSAPDGTAGGLSVVDMTNGQVGARVDLAGDGGPILPIDVGIDSTDGTVYVTTPSGLLVVDESTDQVKASIATTAPPFALAVDTSSHHVFAYEQGADGVVDVIDGKTGSILTSVPTPGFGFTGGALGSGFIVASSFTHHVWAVGTSSGSPAKAGVTKLDAASGSVLGTATFDGTPVGAGIDLQNDDVFVSTTGNGSGPAVNEMRGAQSVVVVGCNPGYLQAQVLSGGYTFLFSQPGLAGCPGSTANGTVVEACGYDGPKAPLCSDPMPLPFVTAPDAVTRIASYFLPDNVVSLLVEKGHVAQGTLTTSPSLRWLEVQTPDQ